MATTVSIRSTNRLPSALSVPPLIRRQITGMSQRPFRPVVRRGREKGDVTNIDRLKGEEALEEAKTAAKAKVKPQSEAKAA